METETKLGTLEEVFPAVSKFALMDVPKTRVIHGNASKTAYIEAFLDLFTVSLGTIFAHLVYAQLKLGRQIQYSSWQIGLYGLSIGLVFVVSLARMRGYGPGSSLLGVRETERVLRATGDTFFVFFAFSYVSRIVFSRWMLALDLVVLPAFVLGEKRLFTAIARHLHRFGYEIQRVIVYGAGFTGRRVFSMLCRSTRLGLEPVLIVDDDPKLAGQVLHDLSYKHSRSQTVARGPLTRSLIEHCGADAVIVAIPSIERQRFTNVIEEATAAGVSISYVPGQVMPSDSEVDYADIDGLLLATWHRPGPHIFYQSSKRVLDFVLSAMLLVLVCPLLLFLGALIKLESRGSTLFTQERTGKDGKRFKMYKFRSMYVDAPKCDYHPRSNEDSRITKVGRWLRKTSLDELPQLLNVLKGEMSLVGPRPEMPFITDRYTSRERQRLWVTPGITGIWQLSADRNYLIHESLQYDLYYLRHRNFFMDLAILLHTLVFATRGI